MTTNPQMRVSGPALVTGAGRGIGRAIALKLALLGSPVCLAARSGEELEATAHSIESLGGQVLVHPCDITAEGAIEELVEVAAARLGGLGVLVNNAGGAHRLAP